MKAKRRKFTAAFKAQGALSAIQEGKSLAELSKQFEVQPPIYPHLIELLTITSHQDFQRFLKTMKIFEELSGQTNMKPEFFKLLT